MKTGKTMMREGQNREKKINDTGSMVQFKDTKSRVALKNLAKDRFKGLNKKIAEKADRKDKEKS